MLVDTEAHIATESVYQYFKLTITFAFAQRTIFRKWVNGVNSLSFTFNDNKLRIDYKPTGTGLFVSNAKHSSTVYDAV